ncbi:MAG: hypothetical protein D6696_20585, partial [Acidobacteria bacterium]
AARARYRRAVELEPRNPTARQALERLAAAAERQAFVDALSAGHRALAAGDYAAARDAFERAAELEPGSPQSADGLAQAEAGLRRAAIDVARRRALAAEAAEDWPQAASAYGSVLALDPTVAFAQEGRARSLARAELDRKLDFHLQNPERLADDAVLAEAGALVAEARRIPHAGPRLAQQIRRLDEALALYRTPIAVDLVSDELTEVVIYRVGRLGRFRHRRLELRPGTYTVVGSRRGFRDVRLTLRLTPGEAPGVLAVRCEEAL